MNFPILEGHLIRSPPHLPPRLLQHSLDQMEPDHPMDQPLDLADPVLHLMTMKGSMKEAIVLDLDQAEHLEQPQEDLPHLDHLARAVLQHLDGSFWKTGLTSGYTIQGPLLRLVQLILDLPDLVLDQG